MGRPYIKSGKAAEKRAIVSLVEPGGRVKSFHNGRNGVSADMAIRLGKAGWGQAET